MSRKKQAAPPPVEQDLTMPDGFSIKEAVEKIREIKRRIAAKEDIQQLAIAIGQDLQMQIALRRLLLGWLGGLVMVDAKYGEKTVQTFAEDVGVKKSTMYQMIAVVDTFGLSTAVEYLNAGAKYGHLRAAMYYGEGIFDKCQILDTALDENWTVERLEIEVYGTEAGADDENGTPPGQGPAYICKMERALLVGADFTSGLVTIKVDDFIGDLLPYVSKPVHLKIGVDKDQVVERPAPPPDNGEDYYNEDERELVPSPVMG